MDVRRAGLGRERFRAGRDRLREARARLWARGGGGGLEARLLCAGRRIVPRRLGGDARLVARGRWLVACSRLDAPWRVVARRRIDARLLVALALARRRLDDGSRALARSAAAVLFVC